MNGQTWAAWAQAVLTVATVGLAWWFGRKDRKDDHKKRVRGYLQTIATDVRYAGRQAHVYLDEPYPAPAYRLPLHGDGEPIRALLAEGTFDSEQADALMQFYVDARSFNLVLDRLFDLYGRDPTADSQQMMGLERDRAVLKAKHLVPAGSPKHDAAVASRYDPVMDALRSAGLGEEWRRPLPLPNRAGYEGPLPPPPPQPALVVL
jgi:hypothetical protein